MPRTALRMPKMSMTMEEGELVGWRIAVGDRVTEGQVVCEVLTDKVDMEVEAPADGTVVGIDVGEGQSVPVGTPIAWIDTESDSLMDDLFAAPSPGTGAAGPADAATGPAADPSAAATSTDPPLTEPGSAASNGTGIVPAIPGARRLAATADLDLHTLRGTGPTGAIMVSDVRAAIERAAAMTPTAQPAPVAAPAPAVAPARPAAPAHVAAPVPLAAPAPAAAPVSPALSGLPATDDDALRTRAAALAPRPGEEMSAPGACLWRDAVLGYQPAPAAPELLARVAAAVGAGLAEVGPAAVRDRPRVGLLVATVAGSVPVTLVAPHLQPFDVLVTEVGAALRQAHAGAVDVRFLAPPDATVTWLDQVDRVAVPVRPGSLVAIGLGSAARRVVAVGEGVGVRTTVTLSATADSRLADPSTVAALLARIAAALEAA